MKTTMQTRTTANPRRTTLAHLTDAGELVVRVPRPRDEADTPRPLPAHTANPRRTVLTKLPNAR